MIDRIPFLHLGNVETEWNHFRRCNACDCTTMQPPCCPSGEEYTTKGSKQTVFKHTQRTSTECLNHLPCIQNQRNPALLDPLWNQVDRLWLSQKNPCSVVAPCRHEEPWILDHGSHLVLCCAWEGCQMSPNSCVSLQPRLISVPWHTTIIMVSFQNSKENQYLYINQWESAMRRKNASYLVNPLSPDLL